MFKNEQKSDILLISIGVGWSLALYLIHYIIFGKWESTVEGILLALAYIPISILCNTFIIKKGLTILQKLKDEKKINVLIGSFFNQVGMEIIYEVIKHDNNIKSLRNYTKIDEKWIDEDYDALVLKLEEYKCNIDVNKIDLMKVERILTENYSLLINLMLNDELQEYDKINEMLLEMMHVKDELEVRCYENKIIESEVEHISDDFCRMLKIMLIEWIVYAKKLRKHYPRMFVRVMRQSPFKARNEGRFIDSKDKINS